MPVDLKSVLDRVIDNRGKSPPTTETETPFELLEVNSLKGSDRNPNYGAVRKYLTKETYNTWFRAGHPRCDDILISTVGSIGELAILDDDRGSIAQNVIAMRPNPKLVDPDFLFYLLSSAIIKNQLTSLNISSVQPSIKVPHLMAVEFDLPNLHDQQRIGNVLKVLDRKIELNRRMNETLEEMARALFRDWFVDFGPTRRQMEGATDPAAIMGQAFPSEKAATLAPLFPAMLGDDGMPDGWSKGEVLDLADLNPKSWSAKNHPQTVEYVDLSNTKWGRIEEVTPYAWSDAPSRARRILEEGDTIVGTVRPGNGSYSLIGKNGLTGSTGFAVLKPKQPNATEFVYCASTSPENIETLANLADGGAYPAINPKVVAATKIVLAGEAVVSVFSEVTQSMFAKRHANEQENQTLAALRDLLLPKLMSGEIRLKDLERAR